MRPTAAYLERIARFASLSVCELEELTESFEVKSTAVETLLTLRFYTRTKTVAIHF